MKAKHYRRLPDRRIKRPFSRTLDRYVVLGVAILVISVWAGAHAGAPTSTPVSESPRPLFDQNGYRIRHYRAPTPAHLPGAEMLITAALQQLIAERTIGELGLIDVMAVAVRPELEAFAVSWLPNETRYHIAGSVWLPNVGFGQLDEMMDSFFQTALWEISRGDRNWPLVFYCVVDCWMSWNAAKRAGSYGYRRIYWYPPGSDGWAESGFPLVAAQPRPLREREDSERTAFAPQVPDLRAHLRSAARNKQLGVLWFFETAQCPFCRRMRSEVLSQATVIDQLREQFRLVAIDSQAPTPIVDSAGDESTFAQVAKAARVRATPTMVFADLNGNTLHRQIGLIADAQAFHGLLEFVADQRYLDMTFRDFLLERRKSRQ